MAIAWGLADAARTLKLPRPAVSIAGSAVVVVLAVVTIAQLGHWQNSMTLFAHALSIDPTNYLAHHQLANELARRGDQDLPAAEIHYRAALESFPEHPRSHLNLARVLAHRGRYREAESSLETALHLDPTLPGARETLTEVRRRLNLAGPPSTIPAD
jgi:tetratricopeptide (TPR) repeat protein